MPTLTPTLDRRPVAAGAGRHRRGGDTPGSSLQERFDPRHNHLTVIRLGLALTVALTHALAVGFGHQPSLGRTLLGDLAVDAFFVLSGFLVTASYLRLRSLPRYAWHRFLRIIPGFWACLVLTALVVAPALAMLAGRPALSVFSGEDSAIDYVVSDAFLLIRQFGIAGLPAGVPEPMVVNGALWTLFYEAACYAGVVLLGLLGALRRRPELTLVALAALWAVTVLHAMGYTVLGQERMLRLALMFLMGCAAWLFAHRIPVHNALAAAAAVVLLVSLLALPDYRTAGGPAFAYLCLWLAVTRPPRRPPHRDISYGLYIYHWPVQTLLVTAGAAAWGEPAFVVVSIALAAALAAASWHVVEKPSLRFKNAAWVDRLTSAPRGRVTH